MAVRLDPEDHELTTLLALTGDLASSTVLEIGCGDGRLTRRIAPRAAHVTAIDPDAARVAAAQAALPPEWAGRVGWHSVGVEGFRPNTPFDRIILSWSL